MPYTTHQNTKENIGDEKEQIGEGHRVLKMCNNFFRNINLY